ncbi:MAG: universal stress protein [Thermodesulfobacteriota bacterium]
MTDYAEHLMGEIDVIALATDGSEFSDGAVQEAIFMGQSCGAKIVVIHVIPMTMMETATQAHASASAIRIRTKDYIHNIMQMAVDNGIECEVVFEESYEPDKTIVELARKHKADLIIMGRHGKRGLLKLMVGSMTAKVIGHGFPRVLVVPRNDTVTGEKLLLATDGSTFSEMAAEDVLSMGQHCSTLKEVYVLSAALKETDIDKAKQRVERICAKAKEMKLASDYIPVTAVGRPSEVISNTAKEKDVDIIVVGGHGRGLTKLLMGHVTEKVIGRADCAVLVVEREK